MNHEVAIEQKDEIFVKRTIIRTYLERVEKTWQGVILSNTGGGLRTLMYELPTVSISVSHRDRCGVRPVPHQREAVRPW